MAKVEKVVRLIVACALENAAKLADVLNDSDLVESVMLADSEPEPEPEPADPLEALRRSLGADASPEPVRRSAPSMARNGRAVKRSTLAGKRVVYSTVGGKRAIGALLDSLGKGTLGAFVLRDVLKHDGTDKQSIIRRATAAGFNGESVDNAVWNMQNRAKRNGAGIVSEAAE